jgi:hypothetical protein
MDTISEFLDAMGIIEAVIGDESRDIDRWELLKTFQFMYGQGEA